jgi:hypothetical protein
MQLSIGKPGGGGGEAGGGIICAKQPLEKAIHSIKKRTILIFLTFI